MIVLVVLSLYSVNKSYGVDCKQYVWICKLISKKYCLCCVLITCTPRNSSRFHKISTPRNWGKLWYFKFLIRYESINKYLVVMYFLTIDQMNLFSCCTKQADEFSDSILRYYQLQTLCLCHTRKYSLLTVTWLYYFQVYFESWTFIKRDWKWLGRPRKIFKKTRKITCCQQILIRWFIKGDTTESL